METREIKRYEATYARTKASLSPLFQLRSQRFNEFGEFLPISSFVLGKEILPLRAKFHRLTYALNPMCLPSSGKALLGEHVWLDALSHLVCLV
jgi:hypothetical protein